MNIKYFLLFESKYLEDKLKIEPFNESTSSVDFTLDNIKLEDIFEVNKEFLNGFSASATENYKSISINQDIENVRPIIEKFMQRYADEWRRLGED